MVSEMVRVGCESASFTMPSWKSQEKRWKLLFTIDGFSIGAEIEVPWEKTSDVYKSNLAYPNGAFRPQSKPLDFQVFAKLDFLPFENYTK